MTYLVDTWIRGSPLVLVRAFPVAVTFYGVGFLASRNLDAPSYDDQLWSMEAVGVSAQNAIDALKEHMDQVYLALYVNRDKMLAGVVSNTLTNGKI